jgi:S-formylglutathione hydrolase FrmB
MGGYGALHVAFDQPGLFAAVATHSAMLLEKIPSAEQGARRGQLAAFHQVFGDPVDTALWNENDPLLQARKVEAKAAPALFLDCGAEDRWPRERHREPTASWRSAASPVSSCRRATTATSMRIRSRRACALMSG